ncbi:hypothetical protein Hanom_Chr12g01164321 [Helianthus anomalus]
MVKSLIYRKYHRRIHHVLTMLRLSRIQRHVTFCVLPYAVVHSMVSHTPITIIPCSPEIILIAA